MKTKIFFILICNLIICNMQFSQNITNTLGTSGVFKIKDGTDDYLTLNQSTGTINLISPLAGNQRGSIFKGIIRFLHTYSGIGTFGNNTFLGMNSGNFTLGGVVEEGSYNTGVGHTSLFSLTTGSSNSAFGYRSLFNNTTGSYNSTFGTRSLSSNTTGYYNSAFGDNSLANNTTGSRNSAFGNFSLFANSTASENSAFGYSSLYFNTTGTWNSAFGSFTLYRNSTGVGNSAFGFFSLNNNSIGIQNTSFGAFTLRNNSTGNDNSAFGYAALSSNTTGIQNSAFGNASLLSNTTGFDNTSVGNNSLYLNTTGTQNTAVGYDALRNNVSGWQNTGIGHHSLINNTGNYNTAIGYNSGSTVTTGENLTLLGIDANPSSPTTSNQITLGNQFVSSLRCNVQSITSLSDARDKKNISELSLGLDFITKLKPRQFNWDKREWYDENVSDGSKMTEAPTAGFIAQELDEVQTSENAAWLNLVLKDNPEKWEATYGNLLPVMIKAIQELKAENDELKKRIEKLENGDFQLTNNR